MANISEEVNIEMLEKLPDGSFKKKNPSTKASQVKLEDSKFTANTVEGGMSELFTNVSDGKDLVGGAITDVDDSVVIPTDPTFGDLASAIGSIGTGKKWASGAIMPSDYDISINGLPFLPKVVIIYQPEGGVEMRYFAERILMTTEQYQDDVVFTQPSSRSDYRTDGIVWHADGFTTQYYLLQSNTTAHWIAFE